MKETMPPQENGLVGSRITSKANTTLEKTREIEKMLEFCKISRKITHVVGLQQFPIMEMSQKLHYLIVLCHILFIPY
jgi:hypothetical protein